MYGKSILRVMLNVPQVFELLTGEYLFDPKESRTYRKDEDHVAQMIELLGDFPAHFIRSGMYANEIFNSRGKSRSLLLLIP